MRRFVETETVDEQRRRGVQTRWEGGVQEADAGEGLLGLHGVGHVAGHREHGSHHPDGDPARSLLGEVPGGEVGALLALSGLLMFAMFAWQRWLNKSSNEENQHLTVLVNLGCAFFIIGVGALIVETLSTFS